MNNANRDYFDGLALKFHQAHGKAFARAKERQANQQQSNAEKLVGVDCNAIVSNAIESTTPLDRDEEYRTTIIQKILTHIQLKKELNNDY